MIENSRWITFLCGLFQDLEVNMFFGLRHHYPVYGSVRERE